MDTLSMDTLSMDTLSMDTLSMDNTPNGLFFNDTSKQQLLLLSIDRPRKPHKTSFQIIQI